jgi:hypothetical protein
MIHRFARAVKVQTRRSPYLAAETRRTQRRSEKNTPGGENKKEAEDPPHEKMPKVGVEPTWA